MLRGQSAPTCHTNYSSAKSWQAGKAKKSRQRQATRKRQRVEALHRSTSSLDSHDEDTIQRLVDNIPKAKDKPWATKAEGKTEEKGQRILLYAAGAFVFGLGIWGTMGPLRAQEFYAGYLLEQSLSIDNLFVFILIFNFFKTPVDAQGKVLFYGLLTAAILRFAMILVGVELVENFKPILLGFAGILLYSSYSLLTKNDKDEDDDDLSKNSLVSFCQRTLNVTAEYDGDQFFTMIDGVKRGTPLLLTLAVIELSDVLFAVDSIPAVFGVTADPLVIWTSNMWALLSLRSLFTFVSSALGDLPYLDKAIAVVLAWISFKLGAEFAGFEISTPFSLGVVALTLFTGVSTSLWKKRTQ